MRDAKITQLYEGTQQIQRLVVAARSCGRDDRRRTRRPDARTDRCRTADRRSPTCGSSSSRSRCRTRRGQERLGPDGRLDRAAVPAVVNGNDEYALEAALKLVEAAGRRRGHPPGDGPAGRPRDAAQGAGDGRHARRPRHRPGARRLGHRSPRSRSWRPPCAASSSTSSSPAPTRRTAAAASSRPGSRPSSACRTCPTPRRSSRRPAGSASTASARRATTSLEAPMPALVVGDPGPRRAALPVAEGDHGRPQQGDRDPLAGRPGPRTGRGRRRGRDDALVGSQAAAGARGDPGGPRTPADEAAGEVVDFLAERRLI